MKIKENKTTDKFISGFLFLRFLNISIKKIFCMQWKEF